MVNKTDLQKKLQKKLEQRRNQSTQVIDALVATSRQESKKIKQKEEKKPTNTVRANTNFTDQVQKKIQLSLDDVKKPEPTVTAKKIHTPKRIKKPRKPITIKLRKPLAEYIPLLVWYSVALLIVLFDQLSKRLASSELVDGTLVLTSWLQFHLVHNPGAAFSLFADMGGWQRPFLVFISAAVSVFLVVWLARMPSAQKLLPLAVTCVLGGAAGNLIDRAASGYVVDFITVHYQQLYFPSFNIADSAITVGAILLFVDMIRESRRNKATSRVAEQVQQAVAKADEKQ